jgi:hypothetical protein
METIEVNLEMLSEHLTNSKNQGEDGIHVTSRVISRYSQDNFSYHFSSNRSFTCDTCSKWRKEVAQFKDYDDYTIMNMFPTDLEGFLAFFYITELRIEARE